MDNSLRRTRPVRRLAVAYDPAANGLHVLRLVLALLVLFGHAFVLGGMGAAPRFGTTSCLVLAVDAFFVISGFLLVESYRRAASTRHYLFHRCLRILPGYWVQLLVVALLVGPLIHLLERPATGGYWTAADGPLPFIVRNLGLVQGQWSLSGLMQAHPHPYAVNGSLWTLAYEALCYVAVALAGRAGLLRSARPAVLPLAVAVLSGLAVADPTSHLLRLALAFAVGALLRSHADRVVLHPVLAAAAVLAVALAGADERTGVLSGLPLAYVVVYVASSWRRPVVGRADLSFGIYIYAFPVQQLLVSADAHRLGLVAYIGLTLALVLPAAWLSFHAVERPALLLRRDLPKERTTSSAPTVR